MYLAGPPERRSPRTRGCARQRPPVSAALAATDDVVGGPTLHPEEGKESDWPSEAKIAGRAISADPVTTDEASEQPDGEMFIAEIAEVVITGLNAEATKLVVELWTPERGLRRFERD
jgi:hypothetical protein